MKILCLTPLLNKTGIVTSLLKTGPGASLRLQIYPAMTAAIQRGDDFTAVSIRNLNEINSNLIDLKADLLLIGKISARSIEEIVPIHEATERILEQVNFHGGKSCLLYSDNLLASTQTSTKNFYRRICSKVNFIITPTEALYNYCSEHASPKSKLLIIEDPCRIKKQPMKKMSFDQAEARIAWFGHDSNINYLINILPGLIKSLNDKYVYQFAILSSMNGLTKLAKRLKTIKHTQKNIKFKLIEWQSSNQPVQLENFLGKSHITIIPSDASDPLKNGASHNRLFDAVQSGCIAIASPLESYKELCNVSVITNNIAENINSVLNNYNSISESIEKNREDAMKRFSKKNNQLLWKIFFDMVDAECKRDIPKSDTPNCNS